MATTNELLAQLNVIRSKNGMPAMKAWKSSRENLEAALAKYADPAGKPVTKGPTVAGNGAYASGAEAKAKTGHTSRGKAKVTKARKALERAVKATKAKTSAKARPAKATATKARTVSVPKDHTSIADIARSINMSPKAARSKARRSDALINLAQDKLRWLFANKDKAKVALLLKPKA